jgi:hypothetical protein
MEVQLESLKKSPWLLNGICPYFTMFPLQYPVEILNNIKDPAVVLDPFSGRGTSLFAARMFGYEAYGIDNNPVAVAISKAKLANTTVKAISDTLELALNYEASFEVPQSEFWKTAFEETVLNQLCRVRAFLLCHEGENESALRGLILGALHGPKAKKIENNSYLSNQMPRTFSSKPNYSVNFWKKHNLLPEKIDIRGVVKKRAHRYFDNDIPNIKKNIIEGDSRNITSYQGLPLATLIITSPPYYGMQSYYTDQWLRNWFLGGPDDPVNDLNNQMNHGSPEHFASDLSNVWNNCYLASTSDSIMYIRFGSIPSRKASAKDIFYRSIELSDGPWKIVSVSDAGSSLLGHRQANQMIPNKGSIPNLEFDAELKKDA